MQSSYSIQFNVFGWKVRYKPWYLSKGGVYDCIYTASWGYYPRVATIKTSAVNWYNTVYLFSIVIIIIVNIIVIVIINADTVI